MNAPTLKTQEEIAIMREGGKILARILHELAKKAQPGITTEMLDQEAEKLFTALKVKPSFKGYRGYPANICASVNEEIVHAIPGKRRLYEGDIITLDAGVLHKGFHTDSAVTVPVGTIKPEITTFLKIVESALYKAISIIRPGIKIGDLSELIQKTVEKKGYSAVRDLTGHGIGKTLHEPPMIPNFGKKNTGLSLIPGMTIAIEPIVNMGERFMKTLDDGWTIVTRDGSLSCQFEHTIVITTKGAEILTCLENIQ
ncbi:type I methionyl aminopeptidase [Candidatus Peregrinibacteria bacterium]|nr:type I methionyl aminopeptidase [Candidatus Peregrinibacteria bacterium]